jgi:purine-nucleoside phosphorylase
MQNTSKVQQAADWLAARLGPLKSDAVGVILGTGLGRWADGLGGQRVLYADIPGFPRSTVESHAGALIKGEVGGRQVLALSGRFHLYEGYEPDEVCLAVRALALLGLGTLIITNAAGALNPQFETGSLMVITDHVNATGQTPLRGPIVEYWGERFPEMSRVWCRAFSDIALTGRTPGPARGARGLRPGHGPQLETPAETRIAAGARRRRRGHVHGHGGHRRRHMGVALLGISCLTNKKLPDCMGETSLAEVIAQPRRPRPPGRAPLGGHPATSGRRGLMPDRPRPGGCGVITPPHLASPTRAGWRPCWPRRSESDGRRPGPGLGCGSGEYRHLFVGRTYLGLDLEDREFTPKLGQNVAFALADAHRLPLTDGCAAFILCAYAFDRFAAPEAAMAEIARVLTPGGAAFLALPAAAVKAFDLPLYGLRRLGFLRDSSLGPDPHKTGNITGPAELRALDGRHGPHCPPHGPGRPLRIPADTRWLW